MIITNVLPRLSFFIGILLTTFTAHATIYYVDGMASGAGSGISWATAFNNIPDALDATISGDEIWVKNGYHYPTTTTDRTVSITLKKGVMLYGGFDGTETNRNQRDSINTQTIISGDIGVLGNKTDNSYSVIYSENVDSLSGLNGFIIQLGNANGSGFESYENGGGWYNAGTISQGSHPTISYCTFYNNKTNGLGGGLFNAGKASPSITHCTFLSNTAYEGGAIFNGGHIAGLNNPVIDNCTFKSNSATFGGAIYISGNLGIAQPKILNCLFELNTATGTGCIGAAIYTFGKDGGIAHPVIVNTIFLGNISLHSAGAVYTLASTNATGKTDIINCVFYGNLAGNNGGAVYLNESDGGDGQINISNTIFNNNTAPNNPHFHMSADSIHQTPTIVIQNCLIDAADCDDIMLLHSNDVFNCNGSMVFSSNPMFMDPGNLDFSIDDASPAKNTGDNNKVPSYITKDKLGNDRIIDGTVDIGAIENAAVSLPVELLEFTAQFNQEKVDLSWITASETNNAFFAVERSNNGRDFEEIELIEGAGNSSHALRYEAKDNNPHTGLNYYRLKQIDFDGTYSYSEIEVVEVVKGRVKVYPNPVADALYISLSEFEKGSAHFSVSNISGKEVISGETAVNAGVSVIRLDEVTSLIPGTYIVRVFTPNKGAFSTKFLKTRM